MAAEGMNQAESEIRTNNVKIATVENEDQALCDSTIFSSFLLAEESMSEKTKKN